jgi:hypothetical protein
MRKLELKDICSYLPHGLYVLYKTKQHKCVSLCRRESEYFVGIERVRNGYKSNNICVIETIKPILRPLSDLYETIIHNGKEIIPIVELAKIHNPNLEWKHNQATALNQLYEFGYDYDFGFFCYFQDEKCYIYNQYQLFDFLHELKIDYRGLIDAGLAIYVNRLEYNPYE